MTTPSVNEATVSVPGPIDRARLCAECLARVRKLAPRVHCITNDAATTYSANMLLAVGAIPSLSIAEDEIVDFVRTADALLINLGTMDAERHRSIELALGAAKDYAKPWVLDPVMIDRSTLRLKRAVKLLRSDPDVIRGNTTEIDVLAGALGTSGAGGLAECTGAVVIQTGPVDIVCTDREAVSIHNGHSWMSRVTAMGCAGSALAAAFLALESTSFSAAWAATLTLGVAGEIAGGLARGPGSLQFGLLDALNEVDFDQLAAHARIRFLDQAATRVPGELKLGDSV